MKMADNIACYVLVFALLFASANAHNEAGEFHCDSSGNDLVRAEYRPGIVTLDGSSKDWQSVDGRSFPLRPALDPDEDKQYSGGEMQIKALHDGHFIYFLLQVPGAYQYVQGKQQSCPSVSLMFQVGANATYHDMGGCKESPGSCSSKTCGGHEVDIMHFSLGTAVPGRLYGDNIVDRSNGTGADRFGHLVDLYSWTPHCRYVDGLGPQGNAGTSSGTAQNDWQGAWWHDSIEATSAGLLENQAPYSEVGKAGTYSFEFSRPLRTSDHLQQDVQLTIGGTHKFSAAFWYPAAGNPWRGSSHYSVNCDWINLEIISAGNDLATVSTTSHFSALNVISLLLSIIAFAMSIAVGWWVNKGKSLPFRPIDNL